MAELTEIKAKIQKQLQAYDSLEKRMLDIVPAELLVDYFEKKYAHLKEFYDKEEQECLMMIEVAKEEAESSGKAAQAEKAAEKAAAEKAAADKAAADKAAADKVAAEKAAATKAAAEKAAADKAAAQKIAAERLAAEKEKTAAAQVEREKTANVEREKERERQLQRADTQRGNKPVESASVVQLAAQDKLVGGQRFQLELERQDAKRRIIPNPPKGVADLTDEGVLDTWIRMRDDQDTLNWMVMGYADGSDNKIIVIGKGEGGFQEMKDALPDAPVYMYLRYLFGDTGRSKFVFLTYVPDSLSGLKKAKVVQHRPAVTKFVKYFQIEWHLLRREEMEATTLEKKLLAAGGANYSVQAEDKGDFKSYKGTTASFHGIKQ